MKPLAAQGRLVAAAEWCSCGCASPDAMEQRPPRLDRDAEVPAVEQLAL